MAHVARAAGEGSRSDAEAWRDEANELKEAPVALGSDFRMRECMSDHIGSLCKVGLEALHLIYDDDIATAINIYSRDGVM